MSMRTNAIWLIWIAVGLCIFWATSEALAQPFKGSTIKLDGFEIAIEEGLDTFCIPEADKCFQRNAVCLRPSDKYVVCRLAKKA